MREAIIKNYKLTNIQQIIVPTSVNVLYTAHSDVFEQEIVLKFYTHLQERVYEAEFLKLYHDSCFVKLFDTHSEFNLNIFEKIVPGDSYLCHFTANETIAIKDVCTIVELMRNKFLTPAAMFPNVSTYFSSLNDDYDLKYQLPIQKCKMIFENLISTSDAKNQYLLHGDLHHENILKSRNHIHGFAVIDPKGVIGECEFEIACFILNPIKKMAENQKTADLIQNRIQEFSKQLHLDSIRITKWCFVKAVLSACFAIEDGATDFIEPFSILSLCLNHLSTRYYE